MADFGDLGVDYKVFSVLNAVVEVDFVDSIVWFVEIGARIDGLRLDFSTSNMKFYLLFGS